MWQPAVDLDACMERKCVQEYDAGLAWVVGGVE
jgi:hypothetical protein